MDVAIEMAKTAASLGEVPVGAVIVAADGRIAARAHNRVRTLKDPTAHAEMLAIREACRASSSERLVEHSIYVTLEPCAMCASAISQARLKRLYFAAHDPKSGAVEHGPRVFAHSQCHFRPEVYGGIGEREAAAILRAFFVARR
ncbi:MAG: nucleoside deaminase [Rhodobacteraceae bacterium]|nr:nucleoside deaminase [Paracoccaceae bacterium]